MAPADVGLGGIGCVGHGLTLLQLGLVQPGLQLLHRLGAVLVLRTVVLGGDHDSGRHVGDPDRAVGGVDVLTARARRTVGIDAQLGFVDLNVDVVVDFGIDPDAGEAGVAAGVAVVGADPDQPVDPAFGLQIAVGIFAPDQDASPT